MSNLELRQNMLGMHTGRTAKVSIRREVLPGFHDLTLKEKCLYLMKISKRNTGRQTFAVMGLAIAALAVNYLFMTI